MFHSAGAWLRWSGEQARPLGDTIDTSGDLSSATGGDNPSRGCHPPYAALRERLQLQAEAPRPSPIARIFGLDPLIRRAARPYRGAMAELSVAAVLSALGDDWTVLHSVRVGSESDTLDHVVIGPPGVLIISTKNHAGEKVWVGERTFMANDARHPYLQLSDQHNRAIATRLSAAGRPPVAVTSCLVVADPRELVIDARSLHIEVISSRVFGRWLHGLPRLLSPQLVSAISAEAATWPVLSDAEADAEEKVFDFQRLRGRIRLSLLVRLGWLAAALAVTYGTLYQTVFASQGIWT